MTLNPAIDVSCEAGQVRPTHKIRTSDERMDPGGGGINVARVACRLGASVRAVFLAGGPTGHVLDALLERAGLDRAMIAIGGDTRMSLNVYERSSGCEYRFVPEGPRIEEAEWRACLDQARNFASDYVVASGSLPRGAPDDFYARLARSLADDVRLVLDTSGAELREALQGGGLFLVKPSRSEVEELAGRPLPSRQDVAAAASALVGQGRAEHVAVTLGHEGAVLADGSGVCALPALAVEARSAVGAGDSFLAGMVTGFTRGLGSRQAFRLAVAAGTAAVLTPGTDLCHAEDVERLLEQVPEPESL